MRNRRQLFQDARSFAVYYGRGQISQLSQFNIAIVEPSAHTAQEIQALKESDTLVIGYVTIMEQGPFHEMYGRLKEEDFLKVNGERMYKPSFDTYMMDLKSKRWRGLLQYQMGKLLVHEGYDGIFMDTIGNVESPDIPVVESQLQIERATEITRDLRQLFPRHVIIQNNGLERLCLQTAPFLDGICWENPLFSYKESQEWSQSVLNRLVNLKERYGIRSLFLHEENEIKRKPSAGVMAQSIADKHEFLYYEAPDYYV
ncbi:MULTISPECIES: endo alpha-1,4 polygalactosaminidase [unclassified Paenibacillus]|uniref:endo alpha-1,4 polygalactosaminidase n=1 Tax=unclassified Paenibacillus TaxID=185978 RepID=UPI001AE2C4F6|nr:MULTISPECIES: endo alpha-1,4 polygalactosaminidase [unclassified Paenibacillus]MBP1154267.1 endo-alpha-1,4-polygalactosaminidase (GH114 family) [Paenibacillus sp. PvP091]MBP1170348.1 endo-alpha-1,4-polygalactosaminidase (GH114 family) [Paenibacillus sp. PvR098]MBP2441376.1 endo-alpha-1,4-polygalactosaminidase (GH114 family) [Paenibacillus sp. PvP052]